MTKLRAHAELRLEEPIWSWSPGDRTPPFGAISYRLRIRWTEPQSVVAVYTASEKAGRMFGGHGGPLSRPLQATHDLHVSAIYLRLLKERPEEARLWVPEERFSRKRRGQKLPDAELQGASGRTLKVIEFGGSYSPERVLKVHEDCERREVPYEIW